MAGTIVSLASSASNDNWIVNSGAIHHITSLQGLLSDVRNVDRCKREKVRLPNGNSNEITHIGNTQLSAYSKLKNVLYVPDFKFNLMSVTKLTRVLNGATLFLPKLCDFQDLYSSRVKGMVTKMVDYIC